MFSANSHCISYLTKGYKNTISLAKIDSNTKGSSTASKGSVISETNKMKKNSTNLRVRLPALVFALEVLIVVLYALFVTYDDHTNALLQNNMTDHTENAVYQDYTFFADIQVMIFIGFGCLLAFFRRYGFGGMVFNFLTATFSIQWAILVQGFFSFYNDGKIHLGVINLINAEFACAVVLISFGAVLGKTSPVQLLVSLVIVLFLLSHIL